MSESDIFDKLENFLDFQEEVFGKNLFLSGRRLIQPDRADFRADKPDEQAPPIKLQLEKKPDLTTALSEGLFGDVSLVTPGIRDAEVDALLKKLNKANTVEPGWYKTTSLDELKSCIEKCQDCPLGATRTEFVFGTGNPNADIMVIGEAPGADEDAQGEPFVGRAGQLLTKILQAIGLERDDVFICNILKCRPPGNRRPLPYEVDECEPYLVKQIELIKPEFILALGLTAVDTLLKKKHKMADTRGTLTEYRGIKMIVTYHPAALLRNPNLKKQTWEDVQMLRNLYDEILSKRLSNK